MHIPTNILIALRNGIAIVTVAAVSAAAVVTPAPAPTQSETSRTYVVSE